MPIVDFYPLLLPDERKLRGSARSTLRQDREVLRARIRGGLALADVPEEHRRWATEWTDDTAKRSKAIRSAIQVIGDVLAQVVDIATPAVRAQVIDALVSHPGLEHYTDTRTGRRLAGDLFDRVVGAVEPSRHRDST